MIDTITLANKASELLQNEAFVEAVRRTDNTIIDTWRQTGPRELYTTVPSAKQPSNQKKEIVVCFVHTEMFFVHLNKN